MIKVILTECKELNLYIHDWTFLFCKSLQLCKVLVLYWSHWFYSNSTMFVWSWWHNNSSELMNCICHWHQTCKIDYSNIALNNLTIILHMYTCKFSVTKVASILHTLLATATRRHAESRDPHIILFPANSLVLNSPPKFFFL